MLASQRRCEIRATRLHRHLAMVLDVFGEIDGCHSTGTELARDHVAICKGRHKSRFFVAHRPSEPAVIGSSVGATSSGELIGETRVPDRLPAFREICCAAAETGACDVRVFGPPCSTLENKMATALTAPFGLCEGQGRAPFVPSAVCAVPEPSTTMGAVHRTGPHSMVSVPWRASEPVMEIVNFSTGVVSESIAMGAMPTSRLPSYSVPP